MNENISTVDVMNEREYATNLENRDYATNIENRREEEAAGPLLPQDVAQEMRARWDRIQTGFVDEPRVSVKQADELVAQAIQRLSEDFSSARTRLEGQWDRGDNTSTEDLRVALKRYRTFFQKLLTV